MNTVSSRTRSPQPERLPVPPPFVVAAAVCWSAAAGGLDGAIGQGLFCLSQCLLLVWVVLSRAYAPSLLQRTRQLFILLGAAWVWSLLATWIFVGSIPEEAWARLARNFGAAAVLLSGLMLSLVRRQREATLDWIAMLLAAISLAAMLSWVADPQTAAWGQGLGRQNRFQGFVGNVNVNATLAAVAAIWSGWRTLRVWTAWYRWPIRQRLQSVALISAFLVNFLVVLLSATRVVNFTLSAVLILGLSAFLLRGRMGFRPRRRHFAIAAAIIAAVFASQWIGPLSERYADLDEGSNARLAIWAQCLTMWLERPLTGFGLGSFSTVYAHFLPEPRTAAQIWTVNSPHNVVLQALLTGGLVYLALLAGAVWFALRPIVAAIRQRASKPDDHVICAMLAIMLGSASIDIALDYPLSIGLFGLLAGLLLGQSLYRRKAPIADPRPQSDDLEIGIGRALAE